MITSAGSFSTPSESMGPLAARSWTCGISELGLDKLPCEAWWILRGPEDWATAALLVQEYEPYEVEFDPNLTWCSRMCTILRNPHSWNKPGASKVRWIVLLVLLAACAMAAIHLIQVRRSHATLDEEIATLKTRLQQSDAEFLPLGFLTDIEGTTIACSHLGRHEDAAELEELGRLAVYEHVLTPWVHELEQTLRKPIEYVQDQMVPDRQTVLDDLRTVLLLTGPHEPYEPGLNPIQRKWLVPKLLKMWGERRESVSDDEARLAATVLYAALLGLDDGTYELISRDPSVIRHARSLLDELHADERMLMHFFVDLLPTQSSITAFVGLPFKSDDAPRQLYTRETWESRIKPRLRRLDVENEDGWVLAQPEWPSKAVELQTLYFERYIVEWDRAVSSVYLDLSATPYRTMAQPPDISRLSALVDVVPSPLHGILQRLTYETQLEDALPIPDVHEKSRVTADDVGQEFQELVAFERDGDLDRVVAHLKRLRDALRIEEENHHDYEAYTNVERALTEIRPELEAIAEQERGSWSPLIESWILPLASTRWRDGGCAFDAHVLPLSYCRYVVRPFRTEILRMFPFSEGGADVDPEALDRILNPRTGAWSYIYDEYVGHGIVRMDDRYEVREPPERFKHWHPSLHAFVVRMDLLTRALYRDRSSEIGVSFEARMLPPLGPYEADLKLGEALVEGDDWTLLSWPQKSDSIARLRVIRRDGGRPYTFERKGVWAWFRLLALASLSYRDGRLFARWDMKQKDAGAIEVELRGTDANPLFADSGSPRLLMDAFRDIEVPPALVEETPPCNNIEAVFRKVRLDLPFAQEHE